MRDPDELVAEICSWLDVPADELDRRVSGPVATRVGADVDDLNERAAIGDDEAFRVQQVLLARIYDLHMRIPVASTAEGSVVLHGITRKLERATIAAQDARMEPGLLDSAPAEPAQYLSWLKRQARGHRVFKHPYYSDFIRHRATAEDMRQYVIQESVVDGRFDDLLALAQVGTTGAAKMEIAGNYWDEMGNGDATAVHTTLFSRIYDVFGITDDELTNSLTATALLSGNLAVLLCRYRAFYPEAVGFLGMTEWLVPDRFVQVVAAWERLGLPDVGITYHRLHITVDSQHAAGWFHNVVLPAASSPYLRRGMARGALWRLDSSARYLDGRLADVSDLLPAGA